MDERFTRIKTLILEIEDREAELASLTGGQPIAKTRKALTCGKCGQEGHTDRTCTEAHAPRSLEASA